MYIEVFNLEMECLIYFKIVQYNKNKKWKGIYKNLQKKLVLVYEVKQ